jgi:aminobenzoyl-glutamate utilization protein B
MDSAEEDLGKVYMARAGLFNDLDVCLDWHPDYENKANMQSSQAIMIIQKEKCSCSSRSLERSERIRCSELFTTGINFMREHVKPSVRMHYVYIKWRPSSM